MRPPVDKEIALSLKFDVVSCSCRVGICNVVAVVAPVDDDGQESKCLVRSEEIRLINASSSLVGGQGGDDDNGEDNEGCSTAIFVGVLGSMSTAWSSGKLLV